MKHFGRTFSELLFRSGMTQKAVGEKIGASHVTVTRWKDAPTVDAATLEKLCRVFRVPISYWFDADVRGAESLKTAESESAELQLLRGEVAHLRQLVDEKERTIQILMKA